MRLRSLRMLLEQYLPAAASQLPVGPLVASSAGCVCRAGGLARAATGTQARCCVEAPATWPRAPLGAALGRRQAGPWSRPALRALPRRAPRRLVGCYLRGKLCRVALAPPPRLLLHSQCGSGLKKRFAIRELIPLALTPPLLPSASNRKARLTVGALRERKQGVCLCQLPL